MAELTADRGTLLLVAYGRQGRIASPATDELPSNVFWIDLVEPTDKERAIVERSTKLRVPSKEALSEIEVSSRLIIEKEALYLSTTLIGQADSLEPHLCPAGFVLTSDVLVTVRYTQLHTFDHVAESISANLDTATGIGVFTALVEAIVDRGADVLERLGADIDQVSRSTFLNQHPKPRRRGSPPDRLRQMLSSIGRIEGRVSQAREVLLGVERIASFVADVGKEWIDKNYQARLGAVTKDIVSLTEFAEHLSGKVQFLLDAVLGYITIEQNDVFKVLTIVSVVGIPPTLLAGIWGMNFKEMPELNWHFGYPLALFAIALSAVAPLIWFKVRGWF